MPAARGAKETRLEKIKHLSEGLLRSAGRTGVRGNLLEIHDARAPRFDPVFLHSASEAFGIEIDLTRGGRDAAGQKLCCDTASLPFQDRCFSMVVLHHVVEQGDEAELEEACRVLRHSGVLIILGLNRFGCRFRGQRSEDRLPGLAPLSIKRRLDALDMRMSGFAGAGLLCQKQPAFMCNGLSGLGAPLADVLILQAVHAGGAAATPLRFRKPRSSVVQSAAMRG